MSGAAVQSYGPNRCLAELFQTLATSDGFFAFRRRVISTAGLDARWFVLWRLRTRAVLAAVATSFC